MSCNVDPYASVALIPGTVGACIAYSGAGTPKDLYLSNIIPNGAIELFRTLLENTGNAYTVALPLNMKVTVVSASYETLDNMIQCNVTSTFQKYINNATTDTSLPIYKTYTTDNLYFFYVFNTAKFNDMFTDISPGNQKRMTFVNIVASIPVVYYNYECTMFTKPNRGSLTYIGEGIPYQMSVKAIENDNTSYHWRAFSENMGDGTLVVLSGKQIEALSVKLETIDKTLSYDVTYMFTNWIDEIVSNSGTVNSLLMKTLFSIHYTMLGDIILIIDTHSYDAVFGDICPGVKKVLYINHRIY